MARIPHKRDMIAAERRGELPRGTTEELRPTVYRRVCPACGESFKPFSTGHKGFCCGCCAYEWGRTTDEDKELRVLSKGIEVVIYESGLLGTIRSVQKDLSLLIDVEGLEEPLRLTSFDVERVQYLVITHTCRLANGSV